MNNSRSASAETNSTANYDLTLDDVSVERITPRLVIEPLGIENSQVRLCWESRTNANYQLQYRSESTTDIWTDLEPPIPGTNGLACTVQAVSEPHRLYRVVVIP